MTTFATIVQLLPPVAIALASWLLPKYLEKRVTEAARGAVDVSVGKVLTDYKLGVDVQLERYRAGLASELETLRQTLAYDRERYSRDYGLFAAKRNEVYAEAYSQLERARGGYGSRFAKIQSHRDFSRSPAADLKHVAERLELISEGERAALEQEIDAGRLDAARMIATSLNEKDELRRANRSFIEFKNSCVLNALYVSLQLNELLTDAIQAMAMLSVYADEIIDGESVSYKDTGPHYAKVEKALAQIRVAMREEMHAGFNSSHPQLVVVAADA